MFKKLIVIILLFIVMISSLSVFAIGEEDMSWLEIEETEAVFTDVNQGHWYYEAVMTMNKYGIISGYGDGTFGPENPVLREEFAKMMVLALKLELKDADSSFEDVETDYWASKYIESAKNYITAYRFSGLEEWYYKPKNDAVREDMAVALVRALNKDIGDENNYVLDEFIDKDNISENLYNFVASAVYNNLMGGYVEESQRLFKPLAILTRAEAAQLLLNVVREENIVFEEKVVFEDEKDVTEEERFTLDIDYVDGGINLSWNFETDKVITGYKVVASKLNETPVYPMDGYAKYVQNNEVSIYNNDLYNNGDFFKFESDEKYYFSITALTESGNFSSDVKDITMPGEIDIEGRTPLVSVSQVGDSILVQWSEIDRLGLQGYKIVASKNDSTPIYPENGYARWITNLDTKSYLIEPYSSYNGGDLGGSFRPGETYYISVTSVYSSGKIAGSTVKYIMPGEPEEVTGTLERTPVAEVSIVDDHVVIEWSEISTYGLKGYKVVASKSNPNPVYPADGYAYWITDLSVNRKDIYSNTIYNGGDVEGKLLSGEEYYFSITAIYTDENIASNAVKKIMP